MSEAEQSIAHRLNEFVAAAGLTPLEQVTSARFARYFDLLMRWNSRLNLTAVRDAEGILSRHFIESIACAQSLPEEIKTLLDYGSGGGFPGIPIGLCCPEIHVTLAESQNKKAAFLNEAIRVLEINAKVHAARAETISSKFDGVTLRAVDKMEAAVSSALKMIRPRGWLIVMTTRQGIELLQKATSPAIVFDRIDPLPGSEDRIVAIARTNE